MTELVAVRLLGFPLPLWERSQEHVDELLREFALIAVERDTGQNAHAVPRRLLRLVDELTERYAGMNVDTEGVRDAAVARGDLSIDLDYEVPPEVAGACVALGELLDEADAYCRAGAHLLTLATPDDLVRLRRWFLDEFVRQIAGEPPVPWERYAG